MRHRRAGEPCALDNATATYRSVTALTQSADISYIQTQMQQVMDKIDELLTTVNRL